MRWRKKLRQNGRWLIAGLLVLDAALYLGAVGPVRARVQTVHREFNRLRHQILEQRARVEQLTAAREKLSETQVETGDFYRRYLYPRRGAYSHMSRALRTLARETGVELDQITYSLGEPEGNSLRHLSVRTTVVGDWNAALRFLRHLERAGDLILVHRATLAPSNYPGLLSMQLNLGAYLRP